MSLVMLSQIPFILVLVKMLDQVYNEKMLNQFYSEKMMNQTYSVKVYQNS